MAVTKRYQHRKVTRPPPEPGPRERDARDMVDWGDWGAPGFVRRLSSVKEGSLTWQVIAENAEKFSASYASLQGSFKKARVRVGDSSRRAQQRALQFVLSLAQKQQRAARPEDPVQALQRDLLQAVRLGTVKHSSNFTAGSMVFGSLLFLVGAVPWLVPALYLLFFFACIPHRVVSFHKRKWTFFCVDFCYFANLATAAFLIFAPSSPQLETMVYALGDGPLAGALVIWQCAWVFGEWDYGVSVLVHLFPGLAVFCHRYFNTPSGVPAMLQATWCAVRETLTARSANDLLELGSTCVGGPVAKEVVQLGPVWWGLAPLVFYAVWQFTYWMIVQVIFRKFILANGYDTSYNALARRARKADNFWNKLVRRGSIARRCAWYGTLQLIFTLVTLAAFIPLYHSFAAALAWQVIKFVVPVYYGSRYQCEKLPRLLLTKALESVKHKGAK